MSARVTHRFVRAIPEQLEEGIIYVSLDYLTTSHLCACGCGAEVVLPLHPTKWRVSFDGAMVTMSPSVGSRTLPCRSHYLISDGRFVWANRMSDDEFDDALARDRRDDDRWHGRMPHPPRCAEAEPDRPTITSMAERGRRRGGTLDRVRQWFRSGSG